MSSTNHGEADAAHLDALLDQALADSFPASDPIALTTPRRRAAPALDAPEPQRQPRRGASPAAAPS